MRKCASAKSLKAANVAATHVLADFDRTLADAEMLPKERPVIPFADRYADQAHGYAHMLANDKEERREETSSQPAI